jgi:iron complex outermembrane receptor protein
MLDLKGNLGTVPFSGNVGIMGDFAHQSSTGLSGNGGPIVTPVSGGATYAEALPSINLTFKATQQDFVRFFAGREEMRPDMYYMRASRDYSYNSADALSTINSPWGASSGNPELKPWLANSLDVDYEHYFAKGGGYFSFAFFTKRLLSYVYQQNTVESFAGYPYTGSQAPTLNYGIASQYVNGQGGNLSGEEATLQITSEAVSGGVVKGFGININGVLVDSSIRPFGPTGPDAPLPDMSKKAATLTFYFERWGFSARVSDHYQGQTREYIVQFGAPTFSSLGSANDGYSEEIPFHTIDAQISYAFKKGPLSGLTVYIEGRNLNNAPEITYNNGDSRQLDNWQKYGASYRTGASYKF